MKWPPYLLKVRFRNPDHAFALWLPLFVIWPIVLLFLLAIFLVLLPFALLALIYLAVGLDRFLVVERTGSIAAFQPVAGPGG